MFYMPFDTSHIIFGAINPELFLNSSGQMGQISGTYTVSNLSFSEFRQLFMTGRIDDTWQP